MLHELIGSGFQAMLLSGEKMKNNNLPIIDKDLELCCSLLAEMQKTVLTAFLTKLKTGLPSNPAIAILNIFHWRSWNLCPYKNLYNIHSNFI